jgi:transposase
MGIAYGDDLRRKFLLAYDRGEGTLGELADRFLVSVGWAKKVSAQRNRTGKAERVPHQPGRKPRVGPELHPKVLAWVRAESDLTLAELQAKLHSEAGVSLSLPQIWHLLRKLSLRLKKNRSTPTSGTPTPTASSGKSLPPTSVRSRRNA